MPHKDPEVRREYQRKYAVIWRERHQAKLREYQRVWKKQWRKDNPEVFRETQRRSYLKHRDSRIADMRVRYAKVKSDPVQYAKFRADCDAWKKANPEKVKAGIKRWQEANMDRVRSFWKKNAALRRHGVGVFTYEQWIARLDFYGRRCAYCSIELTEAKATIDHVISIKHGGTNWPSNLVPACRSCNCRKNSLRWIPKWLIAKSWPSNSPRSQEVVQP